MSSLLPHGSILLAMIFWATSIPAGKAAVAAMPASEILIIRFGLGAVILWLALLALRRTAGAAVIARPALAIGTLAPAAATLLTYWGLLNTSAVHGVVVMGGAPIATSLLAWWVLRERISPWVLGGTAIASVGLSILIANDDSVGATLWGDALCLLAVIIAAFSQTKQRHLGLSHANAIAITAWQMIGATIVCLFVMVFFESWLDERGWIAVPSADIWLLILYLAAFVTAIPFTLANYTLRRLPAGHVALYSVLMAPLGVPASAMLLGETVSTTDITALILVTAGVALPAIANLRHRGARRDNSTV